MPARGSRLFLAVALSAATASVAKAADDELILGQTMPYSGPASALSAVGKLQTRYFHMVNEQGGINGHRIKLISLDDGYSPPKAVEQTRRLMLIKSLRPQRFDGARWVPISGTIEIQ